MELNILYSTLIQFYGNPAGLSDKIEYKRGVGKFGGFCIPKPLLQTFIGALMDKR